MFIERTRRWLITAVLAWRSAVIPTAFSQAIGLQGDVIWAYLPVTLFLAILNAVLALAVFKGWLLPGKRFVYADAFFTVALNVFTVALIPPHTYLLNYHDTFWLYGLGTVGLASLILGVRPACLVTAAGFVLQVWLALSNHAPLTGRNWLVIAVRDGWLANGLVMPAVIARHAYAGARVADTEGRCAGAADERLRHLSTMHDTALQTLCQIVWRSSPDTSPRPSRLNDIRALATAGLEALHDQARQERVADLADALHRLVEDFGRRELQVTLLNSAPIAGLSTGQVNNLTGAVREALTNTLRHAGAATSTITVTAADENVEVTVCDAGRGFDPAAPTRGYGIENSIRRRIAGNGGTVAIRSVPGQGTEIKLRVPASHHPDFDTLTKRSLEWAVIAALAYRIVLSPLQALSAVAYNKLTLPLTFWAALAAVLAADLLVLVGISAGHLQGLLKSRLYFLGDVAVTAGLNIWAASILPRGTEGLPGRELLWGYALGVVVYWTIIRGPAVGAALTIAGGALLAAMLAANGTRLEGVSTSQTMGRQAYLTLAFSTAWLLVFLARRSSAQAVEQGHRTGETEERLQILTTVHDAVLATFTQIVGCCDNDQAANPLTTIRGLAMAQIGTIAQALDPHPHSGNDLVDQLHRLTNEFRRLGLRVELVITELTTSPTTDTVAALIDAARAALLNTWQHADVTHAVLRAASTDDTTEIVIRDHGRGFDPAATPQGTGIKTSISQRITQIGGTIDLWSMPGQGTRVRLRVRT
ncbi:sensor histidine kinase [Actinomadura gamaensis]|uniref:Sensor histidine kinase n=1 Tax=Actinomadura gamaensis TaxID=1763541 RepID=A0ABV9TT62_9ACTN